MSRVICPPALLAVISRHAVAAAPAEACGLLVGEAEAGIYRVRDAVPAHNLSERPDRFELDPADRVRLQRQLREAGAAGRIIGHYHSHPGAAAEPSSYDRQRAQDEPGIVWLIASVIDGKESGIRGFLATADGLISVPLLTEASQNSAS